MADTLVATPQKSELEPLLDALERLGHASRARSVGRMTCHGIPALDLIVAAAGHGKAQFALQTQYLVDRLGDIRALMCVGAGGSLADDLAPGHIVVGTTTVEHDYTLRFVPASLPSHEPSSALLNAVRTTADRSQLPFRVHFGPIASGDEDVVEPQRANELREATDALCVAWEGSGGARVAAFNELDFLELRAITDGADANASTSYRENLDRAMGNLGALLARWRSPE